MAKTPKFPIPTLKDFMRQFPHDDACLAHLMERWLHNFGRCDRWNFCLTTGTLVPANQEKQ
jgi:hypothetical protein